MLRLIGYWDDRLHVCDFVRSDADPAAQRMVVAYLRSGTVVAVSAGFSVCRICRIRNGSSELTDGDFVWPEGLAHYVEEHGVQLPPEVIAAAERGPAAPVEVAQADVDTEWWAALSPRPCSEHLPGCPRAPSPLSGPCGRCGSPITVGVSETVDGNRLAWGVSTRCDTCGDATEEDGWGEQPDFVRAAILAQSGPVRLRAAGRKRDLLKVFRDRGATMAEAVTAHEQLTGAGLVGTPAEMRLLATRLTAAGATTELAGDQEHLPTDGEYRYSGL
jgi:hypothetical protein